MTWIIEGTMKYVSDAGTGDIVKRGNNFKIFTEVDDHKGQRYTWTQEAPFGEPFAAVGDVLNEMLEGLNKAWFPKSLEEN